MRISIIIPCYNCADTLRQAVDSCYAQGFAPGDFEMILVDDGSTDGTRALIEELASARPEARALFHEENRGGGAARNTGIRAAKADLVYCLDADNILAEASLPRLIDFLCETKADGVAFHERRFFFGTKTKPYSSRWNKISDRPIALGDLFLKDAILLDNFLFTKEAFDRTAGFPTHHGFDTQGFEIRFLAAGNTVRICPNSVFYHRQVGKKRSYFEREYDKGNFSIFYYYCVEEILGKLSPAAIRTIARYDVFARATMEDNLHKQLVEMHERGELFGSRKGEEGCEAFVEGVEAMLAGDASGALVRFGDAARLGIDGVLVYHNAMRCLARLAGAPKPEAKALEIGGRLAPVRKPLYKLGRRSPALMRLLELISRNKKA